MPNTGIIKLRNILSQFVLFIFGYKCSKVPEFIALPNIQE